MILLGVLLQTAAAPSPRAPAPRAAIDRPAPAVPGDEAAPAAPKVRPLDPAVAVETFRSLCWAHLREPDDFRAALPSAPIPLAEVPRTRPGPTETWRAEEGVLTYVAADDLPATVPPRQCTLRTRLAGAADQLSLAARVATALSLGTGRTQTGNGSARTIWDVRQPDARTVRLIATTFNAAGGQSDLRLQALLLAAK